ncbi:hypothetical protein DYB32_002422 [Aphanomyces invadans]|uniref:SUZ domain-containing protein n=1 Tax=Aphanomyces invadans TaxID=157072 RepID=A0A3R7ACP1_9STRA|nr:hypothetical protein DYB32_002422 [Aphanomyces invadans]
MSRKKGAGSSHKHHHKTPTTSGDARSMQDREKAYAEARARIFGDGGQDKPASSPAPSSSEASQPAKAPLTRPSSHQPHGSHHYHQDWKQSKAQYRDRQKEMNDPDFTRHHQPRSAYVYGAPPPHGYGTRYTNDLYTSHAPPFQGDGYYRQQPAARTFQPRPAFAQPPTARNGPASYSMDTDFPPLG